jgi:aminoglycoside phosphotransferase (APT) family kinase protein
MEFAEGKHKDFNDLSDTEIRNFAHAAADLHGITREGTFAKNPDTPDDVEGDQADYLQSHMAHYREWLVQSASSIPPEDQEIIQRAQDEVQQQLEQHRGAFSGREFSLLHNDIVILNVLWDQQQPMLIDWETPAFGDRADEVAYIFAINNTSKGFRQTFLDEYEKYVDDPTLRERIPVYELKNRFMDVAWAITKLHEEAAGTNPLMKKEEGLYRNFYEKRLRGLKDCLGD